MNNLASTDQELKDITLEYLEEIDNTINVIPGDILTLNNNLLHANIGKLDKYKIDKDNMVEVEQLGNKRDIYFTCDGLHSLMSTPYALDVGINIIDKFHL